MWAPCKHLTLAVAAVLTLGLSETAAGAEQSTPYPSKPVRLIVPFATGGTDIIARVITAQLSTQLGRQVVVENRPGAGGTIGMDYVARAEPDGHVLLFTSPSIAISPSFYKLTFDPVKSFKAVGKTAKGPIVFTVHPSLPIKSVRDVISLAKRQPGKLISASSGVGSFTHLATELFKQTAGIDFLIVQYKGGSDALLAILVGDAQLGFNAVTSSLPHIRSGKLRALAIGESIPSGLLPGVPTISQSGLSGYEASTWNGILAPAGIPPAIVDRLQQELAVVLSLPETKKKFEAEGAEVDPLGPADFERFISMEAKKWAAVARNIKP
jgi:tripartite-type tricarboxylate transporter receptor subunit TctC